MDLGEYALEVSAPCVLEAVAAGESRVEFSLCDLCQDRTLSYITVSLQRKTDGRDFGVQVPLPIGNRRGSRAKILLEI